MGCDSLELMSFIVQINLKYDIVKIFPTMFQWQWQLSCWHDEDEVRNYWASSCVASTVSVEECVGFSVLMESVAAF